MTTETLVLQSSPIITTGYIMQVFLSLLIVVALIYVGAKYLLPKFKVDSRSKLIKIVDRVYLEPQVSAYILKVGKKAWLLAVSNKQITKIDQVEEEF
ncbi:MAG: flagellar biosynthetic protein FliO [bacterium]